MSFLKLNDQFKQWVNTIKRDGMTLWFVRKHPATPIVAQLLAVFTVAYALSPIDLIPDFIPVLGFLDDALLLPILIWLTLRAVPLHVIADCRAQADNWFNSKQQKPKSALGAVIILMVWTASAAAAMTAYRNGWF